MFLSDSQSHSVLALGGCPDQDELALFHRGELEDDRADSFAEHLANCQSCQKFVASLQDDFSIEFKSKIRSASFDGALPPGFPRPAPAAVKKLAHQIELLNDPQLVPLDPALETRYELTRFLGAGQFGNVYRARDRKLDTEVAIKITADDITSTARGEQQFIDDVRLVQNWGHPFAVRVVDFGKWRQHQCYVVTELIRGERLDKWLKRKRRPVRQPMLFFNQLLELFRDAHRRHLLHRNLKPANIFLSKDKRIRVADFGLFPDRRYLENAPGYSPEYFRYQAPEQLSLNQPVDQTIDIYSLGKILKFISNCSYFPGEDASQESSPPDCVQQIIARCTAIVPADRFQTVAQLTDAIKQARFWV